VVEKAWVKTKRRSAPFRPKLKYARKKFMDIVSEYLSLRLKTAVKNRTRISKKQGQIINSR
jgi:hypothetical protein